MRLVRVQSGSAIVDLYGRNTFESFFSIIVCNFNSGVSIVRLY